MLALRNSGGVEGGAAPPNLQNMDEDQNTYIFLHPSDGRVLQCFCDVAMCLICEIIVSCSMLTLPSGAILEFETFLRSFLRALDALTYNIRNIPCSANMRNFSRAADIGICNFLAFHKVKMLSLTVFVAFRKLHMLSFALVPPLQKLHMLLLANFSQYS